MVNVVDCGLLLWITQIAVLVLFQQTPWFQSSNGCTGLLLSFATDINRRALSHAKGFICFENLICHDSTGDQKALHHWFEYQNQCSTMKHCQLLNVWYITTGKNKNTVSVTCIYHLFFNFSRTHKRVEAKARSLLLLLISECQNLQQYYHPLSRLTSWISIRWWHFSSNSSCNAFVPRQLAMKK